MRSRKFDKRFIVNITGDHETTLRALALGLNSTVSEAARQSLRVGAKFLNEWISQGQQFATRKNTANKTLLKYPEKARNGKEDL